MSIESSSDRHQAYDKAYACGTEYAQSSHDKCIDGRCVAACGAGGGGVTDRCAHFIDNQSKGVCVQSSVLDGGEGCWPTTGSCDGGNNRGGSLCRSGRNECKGHMYEGMDPNGGDVDCSYGCSKSGTIIGESSKFNPRPQRRGGEQVDTRRINCLDNITRDGYLDYITGGAESCITNCSNNLCKCQDHHQPMHGITIMKTKPHLCNDLQINKMNSNFIGPKNKLSDQLKNNTIPLSFSDQCALLHDIQYELVLNTSDIRDSDNGLRDNLIHNQNNNNEPIENVESPLNLISTSQYTSDFFQDKLASGKARNNPELLKLYEDILNAMLQQKQKVIVNFSFLNRYIRNGKFDLTSSRSKLQEEMESKATDDSNHFFKFWR